MDHSSKLQSGIAQEDMNYDEQGEDEVGPNQDQPMKVSKGKRDTLFSLTLLPAEGGEISVPPKQSQVAQVKEISPPKKSSMFGWLKRKETPTAKKEPQKTEMLPCPRILHLTDAYYCIYNSNVIDIYKYNSSGEKEEGKSKRFKKIEGFTMKAPIVFAKGAKGMVLVGMAEAFEVLLLNLQSQSIENRLRMNEAETEIVGGGFDGQQILIFTRNKFRKFRLEDRSEIKQLEEHAFTLPVQKCKFIDVLKGEKQNYFFVFSEPKQVRYVMESEIHLSTDKDTKEQEAVLRAGEAFHIIEVFRFDQQYKSEHHDIAKIPEEGMFDLSKVFYLGNYTFLVSLHEEIVVIRKQYSRYIIVDNICITSSRLTEESKTGQIVLINMQKIIYNEMEKIYVYNFVYDRDSDKLKTELVDNFKGVDESQIILYDGILLTPRDTTIQVLFYFNIKKIRRPGRAMAVGNDPMDYAEKEQDKNKVKFSVSGIVQLKPIKRLEQLLRSKRPPNEINEFKVRFQVSNLQYYKCQWSVSDKSLNNIINNLLQINDENFIQKELDQVLKKQTHTMSFLISIEQKQIVRLKTTLTAKITNPNTADESVMDYIKRLLESKMFLKKLKYLNEFEAYKEVDFIEIKKLRETSLKEEIKLLSCKGYERRLKNFLNDFKFLAIANFEQIFDFLMASKQDKEIEVFLMSYSFIMPQAQEQSIVAIFVTADEMAKKRRQTQGQECKLWAELEGIGCRQPRDIANSNAVVTPVPTQTNLNVQRPQTIDSFIADILPQEGKQLSPQLEGRQNKLRALLEAYTKSKEFKDGAFKKHCMLVIDEDELYRQFVELKTHKVYDILFRYLYRKLHAQHLNTLQDTISMLVEEGRVPPSYRANVNVRQSVYDLIKRINAPSLKETPLEQFIIMSEPEYFKWLITVNQSIKMAKGEHLIFSTVKETYELKVGSKGFFEQRFNVYLKSKEANLQTLKELLQAFQKLGKDYQKNNHLLMTVLLEGIIRILKICQRDICHEFLTIIENIDLMQPNPEICAKVAEGYFLSNFFDIFKLDYTYQKFIEETKQEERSMFLEEVIGKYSRKQNSEKVFEFKERVEGLSTEPKQMNIEYPLDFFKFVVYMLEQVGFRIPVNAVIEVFLLSMFEVRRYEEVRTITRELFDLVEGVDPKDFFEGLILKHVDHVYTSTDDMEAVYENVKEALTLVQPITIRVKKKLAFLELSLQINRLQDKVLNQFNIRQELHNKPMVFLVHLLQTCDPKYIKEYSNSQMQRQFGIIYQKMMEAVSLDINLRVDASTSKEFLEFEVERGYYYLKKTWVALAIDVCREFAQYNEEDGVYYHDLIYSIACSICQKNSQQSQEDACSVFLQFIITNNEYNKDAKQLVVTEVLRQVSVLDKDAQLKYMRGLEKELKVASNKHVGMSRPISIAENMIFSLVHTLFGMKNTRNGSPPHYMAFMHLINHNSVQAFYFLMKTREMSISSIVETIERIITDKSNCEFISMYFSLAIYIRSLAEVVPSFYPTFSFFIFKKNHLSEDRTRRDINILAEKLRLKEEQSKASSIDRISDILMRYYDMYMRELHLEAVVSLTAVDLEDNLDVEMGFDSKQQEINKDELRIRKELLGNQNKFDSLVATLQHRVQIPEAKPPPIKLTPMPELPVSGSMKPPELPSQKYEKYEEIKKRELEQMKKIEQQSMKEVKTQTNNEIEKIIEKYRMQKQQKMQERRQPSDTGSVREYRSERDPGEGPLNQFPGIRELAPDGSRVRFPKKIEKMEPRQKAQKPYEQRPKPGLLTEREMSEGKIFVADGGESAASNSINLLRRKMQQNQQRMAHTVSSKQSVTDLKDYLMKNGETEVLLYVNKAELVRDNLTLLNEFVKKMFDSSHSFTTFLKALQILLKCQQNISQLYEMKAVKIASQAIRIESKIDPKRLFDVKFFQQPMPDAQVKQFQEIAFTRLRENIIKQVDDQNVHSLAKMMLYGLSLDKKYQHAVYLLFLDARMEEYILRGADDKQIGVLIERIKSVFSKLPRDIRCQRLKEVLAKKGQNNRTRMNELIYKYEEALNRTMKLRNTMVSPDDLELLQIMKTLY